MMSGSASLATSVMLAQEIAAIPEPNLAVSKASLFEKLFGFTLLLPCITLTVLQTLLRRLFQSSDVPVKYDIPMSIARNITMLPEAASRGVMTTIYANDSDSTLNSNRFEPYKTQLNTRVLRPDFGGWWLVQGAPGKPQSPSQSDIVIFFIHGGAYIAGHPLTSAAQLLRIWELAAEKGKSMSIFCVQYTLAPEATFPRPINEAEAAYRYVTDESHVSSSRIAVMGESAGGHLAMALLQRLQEVELPKPAWALLAFPWIDLTNNGASHQFNKYKDFLSTPQLNTAVDKITGVEGRKRFANILDYSIPHPDRASLKLILPKTWVTIGSWDPFYSSNLRFVDQANKDGAQVFLHVREGWPHGWTLIADVLGLKPYLKLDPAQPLQVPLQGADCVFEGLMNLLKQ